MKRIFALALIIVLIGTTLNAKTLSPDVDYYLWLNIYEKLIGSNEAGTAPALSAYGVNSDGYVFTAENSGLDGYVLLRQKSTGRYLAASSANNWSMVFEEKRSTDDRYLWATDEGTYVYLKNRKSGKYVGIDGANKGKDYVSIFYDKPQGSHSQFTAIPAVGKTWDDARAAYVSAAYTNKQGVEEVDYCLVRDLAIDRSDAIDIHITANENPIQGSSTINLGSDRTWLVIDNITPSDVISNYLKFVRIQGQTATDGKNCRVAIFLNGAAVIPTPKVPFEADGIRDFTLAEGNHTDLKANSNAMASFTLRRGYMATLASGRNGSGHSRVYVADHEDLEVELPAALAYRVTSVNIKPWQYLSKKGWADTGGATKGPQLRASWFWSWSAGYNSTRNMEFVPCRQHLYWPSASEVNNKTASAAFSLNEPEHSEQHTSSKCSCGGTISEWNAYLLSSEFQAGGGRIGSPQPTDFSYLTKFCKYVDENNNQSRCDFVVTHAYWNISGRNATDYANYFVNQCKNAWNNTKRPLWITEMEVGSSWGDNLGDYGKYREYLQVLLQKMEECDYIERYAIYAFDHWSSYMFYNDGSITPAGEVYRDHRSTFAYHANYTKAPVWWTPGVSKPTISVTYHANTQTADFNIDNANTDMTSKLVVEMSTDGTEWSPVMTLNERQQFEDRDIEIEDAEVGNLPMGTLFRVVMTTLTGATSTSETAQVGGVINGNINATSKSSVKGWTCVKGCQNGYTKADSGDTYFEAWHPTAEGMSFDYYQDLDGLKNGAYRLQANVFNSSNGVAEATVNGAVGLYAQCGSTTWFAPVTKDSNMDDADLLTIDNIVVTDGRLRIGIRNIKPMTARWAGGDNFAITYLGDVEEVLGIDEYDAIPLAQEAFLQQLTAIEEDTYDLSFLLHNPEATTSTEGWTAKNAEINSGEAFDDKNTDPKNTYYDKWSASNYTSSLEQTILHLPKGDYILSAILRSNTSYTLTLSAGNGTQIQQQAFTGKGAEDNEEFPKGWERVTLGKLAIDEGQDLTIRLTGTGSSWWSADHFQLTYTPVQEKPEPQPNGLALSDEEAEAKMGEAFDAPTLANPYELTVTWSSSDESVATVDQEGNITLVGVGTTVISATFSGNDDYMSGCVSYTLTVVKADPVANELAFSAEEAEAKMGESFDAPTLANPHELTVTWMSSDESVATVDQDGNITLVGAGVTTIFVTFGGNDEYIAGQARYTLLVLKADPVDAELEFSDKEAVATIDSVYVLPTLLNPHELPVSLTSSDETVATVDAEGHVTLLAPGTTLITAAFEGNEDFLPATVSYTLTVENKFDGIHNTYGRNALHVWTYQGIRLDVSGNTSGRISQRLRPGNYIINGKKVLLK